MKKILFIASIVCLYTNVHAQSFEWVKQIGGIKTDRALAITTDGNGNSYTTGHFIDTVDLDPGNGVSKAVATNYGSAFIVKLDAAGNYSKAMTFGGTYYTHVAIGSAIAIDAANNIVTAGYFYGNIDFDPDTSDFIVKSGDYSVFITKLDATGKLLWVKNWKYDKFAGTAIEEGPSMALDIAGNVYTTGRFKGEIDFDPGSTEFVMPGKMEDGYISKLDAEGNLLWVRQLATDTTTSRVHPKSISADAAGNTYITGLFQGTVDFDPDTIASFNITSESPNGFLMKLDAAGNFAWVKRLGNDKDPVFEYHQGNAVIADASGNAYVTGRFMGAVDFGALSLTSEGNSDIFVAQTDTAGNFIWAKSFGSIGDAEEGNTITLDAGGNVYIAGNYRGIVDFDPGPGISNITTRGYTDNFILKLTSTGDFVWVTGYGGAGKDERVSCVSVRGNSVYTVGKFEDPVNFDPNVEYALTAAYKGTGAYVPDAFIHKINQSTTGIRDAKGGFNAAIFPNPATNRFVVDLDGSGVFHADVMLYDMQGRLVAKTSVTNAKKEVVITDVSKGVYLVKIQSDNSFVTSKLVIE